MDALATQRCLPCEGGMPALTREEAERNLAMVSGWTMNPVRNSGSEKSPNGENLNGTKDSIDNNRSVGKISNGVNDEPTEISKSYTFKDFKTALDFTNQIGRIAESEGHHPDLYLGWGKVEVKLTTHAVKGLSVNDFILAAKIDSIQ